MKKIRLVLVSILLVIAVVGSAIAAGGLLPTVSEIRTDSEMPSMRKILLRDPDAIETLADGGTTVTFNNVTEDEFNSFSTYLSEFGCTLADYSVDGTVMTASVEKNGYTFTFTYDYADGTAVLSYPSDTNEETIDIVDEAIKVSYQPGTYVTLGTYPQGANGEVEPIEWLVLDVQDGKVLLISRYGLDAHRFDASTYQGWDKSEIREWLNSTFLNTAFTDKEQECIVTTTVKTGNNADWVAFAKKKGSSYDSVDGGSSTQDKIFLLSLEEAMEYSDYGTLEDFYNKGTEKLQAVPTAYAVTQGAWQQRGSDSSYMLNGTWWWLRSPSRYSSSASLVGQDGSLNYCDVDFHRGVVRPAFWLNLESDYFSENSENMSSQSAPATKTSIEIIDEQLQGTWSI